MFASSRRRLPLVLVLALGCASPGQPATPPVVVAPVAAVAAAAPALPGLPPDWRFPMRAQVAPSVGGVVSSDAALATKVGLEVLAAAG
jgi:hypothetical protein